MYFIVQNKAPQWKRLGSLAEWSKALCLGFTSVNHIPQSIYWRRFESCGSHPFFCFLLPGLKQLALFQFYRYYSFV